MMRRLRCELADMAQSYFLSREVKNGRRKRGIARKHVLSRATTHASNTCSSKAAFFHEAHLSCSESVRADSTQRDRAVRRQKSHSKPQIFANISDEHSCNIAYMRPK